ncbi:flagellar basal-body rod protein FlgG [Thioflavicoccus mobilis 8321]|uniref:Flagellar basal-body rod protein FlgG n=1 Tax=Thioflavicoccus mobilis 8321 TaxID=765912 RepID=L0H3C2_9GAMM|nr:flagellar basal-body rod protein FlgG [Thioflavicoccus mobilis]AGA92160.1 flagellar basal-body rod protein FlgG [Thioflavicoccus mobilis 8321]
MFPALWISKTGLEAQQTNLAITSNNLANVNTNGFKRSRAVFQDLLYQTVRQPGGQETEDTELPSGLTLGTGVRTAATAKLFTQGNIVQTGNDLDVAINGRGFLQVLSPDGSIVYTRDGAMQRNAEGQLVTASGMPIEPAITLPDGASSVTIGSDGTVSAQLVGDEAPTLVGQIELVDFINPAGLTPIGENLFRETAASGPPQAGTPGLDGLGVLVQGSVESSNVNVVEELVNMIETQRAYEMNSKAIATADDMLRFVAQNL